MSFEKYNVIWENGYRLNPLKMELQCIARGGRWTDKKGRICGAGLFEHYMNARKIMWPKRYRHAWTDLMYHNFIENDITILLGAASAQKTSHAVEFALISYLARPENTLVILSTTTMDKLDIGVWAELSMLWRNAKELYSDIPGHIVGYKRAITTDDIEEDGFRDFRAGTICRPCRIGGRWVGLGTLAGVKQENIIYVCDELQYMDETFSGSWPHLFSNGNVKIIGCGNPKHDPEDQLSITAEPKDGWASHPEPTKTEVWETKFMGGKCVNLVGTDSPNFHAPRDKPEPYPRLIGPKFAERIAHDSGGENSFDYYRLVKGVMKMGFALSRVITRQICRENLAMEQPVWKDDRQTKGYALDPTYGGEDRCVGMPFKFGQDINGKQILAFGQYRIFQINLQKPMSPEDQIAEIMAEELGIYGIASENVFYDSTGKGTIGAAFAKKFGSKAPVAVDSGAMPSERPVRDDLYIVDEKTGTRRPKTCREHYSKFVSEMWFSIRYIILAGQLRGLLEDVMTEGCARIYNMVGGNKIEVEPKSDPKKKEDLKRRLGKSPDLFDCLAVGGEGARQLGFHIGRLGENVVEKEQSDDWFQKEADEYRKAVKEGLLVRK